MQISVANNRGIKNATLDLLTPLTIIVGPNGCGKSTLLNQARANTYGQHIYIGPHRSSRRQHVRMRFMGNHMPSMSDMMSQPNLQPMEGITSTSRNRDAWELDEAANFIKPSLAKYEFQRQNAVSRYFDKHGSVPAGSIPDIWEPLRTMTENLLPHLSFSRIETENIDNIRCLFHSHDKSIEVDIDDFSSGEKAVIQLIFPIIEDSVRLILSNIIGESMTASNKNLIIIDEPELHLHPSLQEKLVSYLRVDADKNNRKVLIATHSPTIIDAADYGEIRLLRPAELCVDGENQVCMVTNNIEKLKLAQVAIGSVFPITSMRPMLFIEGEFDAHKRQSYSDKMIYEFIDSRFYRLDIVPKGGKVQVLTSLAATAEFLDSTPYMTRCFALVDRDHDLEPEIDGRVFRLPACMIENMLIIPDVLRAGFGVLSVRSELQSDLQFSEAIANVFKCLRNEEISRRFRRKIRLATFGPDRSIIDIDTADNYRQAFLGRVSEIDFKAFWNASVEEVEKIENEYSQAKYFSGKDFMRAFIARYVEPLGLTKPIFIYQCAKFVGESGCYEAYFDSLFASMLGLGAQAPVNIGAAA